MERQKCYTVGHIADILQEPPARVGYIIGKYRLKPVERVGIIRLFSEEQIEIIHQGLYRIQIREGR